jgi:putative transposase
MRQQGLVGIKPRRRPFTSQRSPGAATAPNLLARDFQARFPNQKWVADVTTIATAEGRLYLATILDPCSRMIVGWSIADHMQTSQVEGALGMALGRRRLSPGWLHHSDQGSQYTSDACRARLAALGARVSMNGVGNCYDNAVMESFYATLKTECAPYAFRSRQEATTAIFEYIEGWYNRRRIHSSLGCLSPASFEHQVSLDKNTVHKAGASPVVVYRGRGMEWGLEEETAGSTVPGLFPRNRPPTGKERLSYTTCTFSMLVRASPLAGIPAVTTTRSPVRTIPASRAAAAVRASISSVVS